ncbi:alanine racemase [Tamilnaduibacter salinus]|uniref:Alanine racemase n=1 Tax=Tamilnaduibacter salinus TaxID=1484056 RepID=A0A2A2I195_9GAMM|nr:DSD1 family PLP-dependent enzyme [Tamilnaduibacter salinus]PAV25054.1 alanine racemase [Tamilnaduibacter salinus]
MSLSRRQLLIGGAATAGAVGLGLLRPSDQGGPHDRYFQSLQRCLSEQPLARPTMVIDRDRLHHNLNLVTRRLGDQYALRLVAKSLPSLSLLDHLMNHAGTRRLMLFHRPFVSQVAAHRPDADILLGKPMPVDEARLFYQEWQPAGGFQPETQLQWLIDSPQRLLDYQQLAAERDQPLGINVELDIGLHRGGVADRDRLAAMLTRIRDDKRLRFRGFMGYEPHIVKVPGDDHALRDEAMARYREAVHTARAVFGTLPAGLTFNTGGSSTYTLYPGQDTPANEIALGSGLVMPTDFDVPTLSGHRPACVIATPVLKTMAPARLPGPGALASLMRLWNPNRQQAFFIYGGHWKARPVSPPGLSPNPVFGRSSNQEMLNGSDAVPIAPGDWVFLRPHQSESVFLQFGDLALYDPERQALTDRWPVLRG